MTEVFNKVANARLQVRGKGPTRFLTALYSAASGGVWVGGRVVLDDKHLTFSANKMNRALQSGTLDVSIPVSSITGAKIAGGLVTKIVAVELKNAEPFEFRCSGTRRIIEQLHVVVAE